VKILRIRLEHFRGITSREIVLQPAGITVVEGPNEVGKSCVPEAIGLIRSYLDSSRAKAVTDVRPVGQDVGPKVELEVVTGPYHLVYTKQFLSRPSTELRILAPRPEQLAGREAHDRFDTLLAETLDPQLWDALQVVQGDSLRQPVLARIEPLRTALGATDAKPGPGGHDALIGRIEQEYARYFTSKTGKVTGDYEATAARVASTRQQVDQLRARLGEAEDRIAQYARIEAELRQVCAAQRPVLRELEELRSRRRRLDELERAAELSQADVERAQATRAEAERAVAQRGELAAEHRRRVDEHEQCEVELSHLEQRCTQQRLDADLAAAAAAEAMTAAEQLSARQRAADDALASARAHQDLRLLGDRIGAATAARITAAEAAARLENNPIDDAIVAELQAAQTGLLVAEAKRDAGAPRLFVTSLGGRRIDVDGSTLDADHEAAVTSQSIVEVPGVVRVVVCAGQDGHELVAAAEACARRWQLLLDRHVIGDLTTARDAAGRRRHDLVERQLARRSLAEALDGDDLDEMRARHEALRDRVLTPVGRTTPSAAASAKCVRGAERAAGLARDAADAAAASAADLRAAAEAAAGVLMLRDVERIKLQQRLDGARVERERTARALQASRDELSDNELRTVVAHAVKRLHDAVVLHDEGRDELSAAGADELRIVLDNAAAKHERLARDTHELTAQQHRLRGQLDDIEGQGLKDHLDAAGAALDDAERVHGRLAQRAAAVRLLRATFTRHRDDAQSRYVQPFTQALERLGRLVFGPEMRVHVSSELAIESVTRGGVTVPFEALSGGAKEQLAVLGRLVCAQLVGAADGAPVVLDDSLGFADPGRLERMAAVLNEVGQTNQIIVLTCQPDRFRSIGSAVVVRLDAA